MKVMNCGHWTKVQTLEEASKLVRATIDDRDMGSEEWYGHSRNGIVQQYGQTIAQISYNGRIWSDPSGIAYAQGRTTK